MAKSTVAVKFTGDVADLKKSTGEAEREMEGFGSRVGPKLKVAMAGAGLAAGAALTDAFFTHLDNETTVARFKGSLGLSDADADQLGATAGAIYRDGFGESFEEVAGTVAAVLSEIDEELSGEQLDEITRKALNFATVFGQDASEAIGTVGFMLRNDLVEDAEEAFDVLTTGFQQTPKQIRDEIFPTFNEYSANFAALGIDAETAFGIMLAAGENASVGFDKTGDAIKEFLIRSTDGSAASTEALEKLGLNADVTASQIVEGGERAADGFQFIIDKLLEIEDPAERAQTAIALFGTPLEDLSVDQIPTFLEALGDTEDALGDVEGAADDMGDGLDNNQRKIESFKRKLQGELVDFIAEEAIPAIEDLEENWNGTMLLMGRSVDDFVQEAIDRFGDLTEHIGGLPGAILDVLGLGAGAIGSLIPESDLPPITPEQEVRRLPEPEPEPEPRRVDQPGGPTITDEDLIPIEGAFATGGTVPGPKGKPMGAIVHGGEKVLTPEQQQNSGGIQINDGGSLITVNGGDHDADSIASIVAWRVARLN